MIGGLGGFTMSGVGGTEMLCDPPDVMQAEEIYLGAFARINRAAIDAGRLVLLGPDVDLRYIRIEPLAIDDVTDRHWLLESLTSNGQVRLAVGDPAALEIRSSGTLEGSTGCRRITATYIIRGDEIWTPSASAFGDCPLELQEQDSQVVGVLLDRFAIARERDRLIVESRHPQVLGQGLVYVPAEGD